jgi:hypothetical protein
MPSIDVTLQRHNWMVPFWRAVLVLALFAVLMLILLAFRMWPLATTVAVALVALGGQAALRGLRHFFDLADDPDEEFTLNALQR